MENIMQRPRGKKTRGCRGSTMVEFSLVFMLFLIVVLTMLEMARGLWSYATIATATRQVGAYAQVHGTLDLPVEAEALEIMNRWCAALDADDLTIAAVYNPDEDGGFTDTTLIERGDIVEIRIGYNFRLITGNLVIDGGVIPMASTTRMVVAN